MTTLRKRVALFAAMILIVAGASTQTQAQTSAPFGCNWFNGDTSLHKVHGTGNWQQFVDDWLGWNTQHYGATLQQMETWSSVKGDSLIATDGGALDRFSGAEGMKYKCLPKHLIGSSIPLFDTLTNFDFDSMYLGYPWQNNPDSPYSYWDIPLAPSDSQGIDVVIADSNENLNTPINNNVTWRDSGSYYAAPYPFRLAVKLQIPNADTSDSSIMLRITVVQRLYDPNALSQGTTSEEKFDTAFIDTIYHCQVRQPNADVVLFSKWFKFNYDLTNDATNGNLVTEVKLAVHSPRTTEVRLAWVALNDIWADSLLAGRSENLFGLGSSDTTQIRISNTTVYNEIQADEQAMRDACQGQLKRFYLHDECQVSEFICQGVVNSMIRDSGETERSLYQERRYAAIVQPKTFRCGNWYSNSLWQQGVTAFYDKGPDFGRIIAFDSLDTAGNDSVYTIATAVQNHQYGAGYYPVANGIYAVDSSYAYDIITRLVSYTNNPNSGYTDSSFDFYDYSAHTNHGEQQTPSAFEGNTFLNAVAADSIVYIAPSEGAPGEWWANIFMNGNANIVGGGNGHNNDTNNGAYYIATGSTPEQLSLTSNIALSMGARGLMYWWATTANCLPFLNIAFTDRNGNADIDYDTIYDTIRNKFDTLVTDYKRNCLWSHNYSNFLKGPFSEIYNHCQWQGAFIRTMMNNAFWYIYLPKNGNAWLNDSLIPDTQTILRPGFPVLTNPAGDSSSRFILDSTKACLHPWPLGPGKTFRTVQFGDSVVKEIGMPKDLDWVLYGYFLDTTTNLPVLTCENCWLDPRDLLCRYSVGEDSAGAIQRGTRRIFTCLALDSTKSQYWRVQALDSSFMGILPWNGTLVNIYKPGELKIYMFTPFCNFAQRNVIDPNGVSLNNGTHCVKHSDGGYRTVYIRGDSVFERKMTDCGVREEQCVEPGGNVQNTFGVFNNCDTLAPPPPPPPPPPYPSPNNKSTGSTTYITTCLNPTITQHRGNLDEDFIVWEEDCRTIVTGLAGDTTSNTLSKTIRAIPWSYGADAAMMNFALLIADSVTLGNSTTFPSTPVITGTNAGYVVSYADSGVGIKVCPIEGSAGIYYLDSIYTINCPSQKQPAMFPSIAWGTDIAQYPNYPTLFAPAAHLVWQQPDTGGIEQIWHTTVDVFYTYQNSGSCTWVGFDSVKQVSISDSFWCSNTMPSISVDGQQDTTNGNIITDNNSFIVWHAFILNPLINNDRVCLRVRQFHGGLGLFSPVFVFASGSEAYYEPNIYIPPIGAGWNNVKFCWWTNKDSLNLIRSTFLTSNGVPLSFVNNDSLLSYPLLGMHNTLSYSLVSDMSPSTVSQSQNIQYQLQTTEFSALNLVVDSGLSATHNGITLNPKWQNGYISGGCTYYAPYVAITTYPGAGHQDSYYNNGTIGIPAVQPISIAQQTPGNGAVENTIVRTQNFVIVPWQPFAVYRTIGSTDPIANTALLATGKSVEALIELVDSATNTPLITLDSFLITTANDTGWRDGPKSFMPDTVFGGMTVYVRARILADTNVAHWDVVSMSEVNPPVPATPPTTYDTIPEPPQAPPDTNHAPAMDTVIAYPNPTFGSVQFQYQTLTTGSVLLTVNNMLGYQLASLPQGNKSAGNYTAMFNFTSYTPGTYKINLYVNGVLSGTGTVIVL